MTRDLMIRLTGDGNGFALIMLEIADDGFVMRAYRQEFPGPFRARDLDTLTPGYERWPLLTREELEEILRIRRKAKTSPPVRKEKESDGS